MKISKQETPPPPVTNTKSRNAKYQAVYDAVNNAEIYEWVKVSELSKTEAKSIILGLYRHSQRGTFGKVKVETSQRMNGDGFAVWLRKVEAE